jgi:hypothetical protein
MATPVSDSEFLELLPLLFKNKKVEVKEKNLKLFNSFSTFFSTINIPIAYPLKEANFTANNCQ